MARTKVTPLRRERQVPSWLLRQNRRRQRIKRTYPYKIKLPLPEQKQVDITKDGNVIKTILSDGNLPISTTGTPEYFNYLIRSGIVKFQLTK